MEKRQIVYEVTKCVDCLSFQQPDWCFKKLDVIPDILSIPKWCPLPPVTSPTMEEKVVFNASAEERQIVELIKSARNIQEFLWGEMNAESGYEEIKRMFRKRVEKLDEVNTDNPHWKVEVRKRLLQVGAIAI